MSCERHGGSGLAADCTCMEADEIDDVERDAVASWACPRCKVAAGMTCDPRVAPFGPNSWWLHDERVDAAWTGGRAPDGQLPSHVENPGDGAAS